MLQDEQASAPQRLLRTHWHLQLLSDFVTQTSCRQGRNQHPFDKEQTLFLVQNAFGCVSSGSCLERTMYQCLHEDHSSTPAERDGQETKLVCELHTLGKALELFVLLEVCMSPVVLRHVGVELHLQCRFQDQARCLLSSTRERTGVKLCTAVKKQIPCTSLSPCGHEIDCHTDDPRCHVGIGRESSNCTRCL